jgi:hypothetical protein
LNGRKPSEIASSSEDLPLPEAPAMSAPATHAERDGVVAVEDAPVDDLQPRQVELFSQGRLFLRWRAAVCRVVRRTPNIGRGDDISGVTRGRVGRGLCAEGGATVKHETHGADEACATVSVGWVWVYG